MGQRSALIVLMVLGLFLIDQPLAAGEWTQTDWSGGETTEVVTGTTTKYRTGENENVLVAGKVILDNRPAEVENKYPTASGKSAGFIDNDNVLTSNDTYAKGTGVAGWVDHVVISEVLMNGVANDEVEKVELYNPTPFVIDLSNWTLDTQTYADDATVDAGKSIPAFGFFTIGDAATADEIETITLTDLDACVQIQNAAGVTIDAVGWGAPTGGNASWEGTATANTASTEMLWRKALSTSTAASLTTGGADENNGNGYDTDNNVNDLVVATAENAKLSTDSPKRPNWLTENDNIWAGGFATGTGTISAVRLKVEYKVSAAATDDDLVIKYTLDGGATWGATSYTFTPTATSDTVVTVDVTSDRSWTWTDITNLQIYVIYNIDGTSDGKDVSIDAMWVEVTKIGPYTPFAYLESSVFDAGANADWKTVVWNATVPAQTGENVYLRSGPDNNPYDEGWGSWCKHDNDSENTSLENNRYVQYRVELKTADNTVTPEFLDITINYNSFSVSASPTEVTVVRGGATKSTTVTVKLLAGTVGTVALSGSWVGGEPSGVSSTFDPSPVDLSSVGVGENKTSTLSFTASSGASTGTFTFRIKGDASGLINTYDMTVKITTFDYRVDAFPENLSMMRAESKTSEITVKAVEGDQGTVTLSGSWVGYEAGKGPTGISASISTTSGTPTYKSILTVSTGTNAEGGSFLYRITATGGGVSKYADVRVTVDVGLTLTLSTDKSSYEKGQIIQISGTAKNPKGEDVRGTATIRLENVGLIKQGSVKIEKGKFSFSYQVSYADNEGSWTIKVTAVDNLNNTGETSSKIYVGTPPNVFYYATSVKITTGFIYSRGGRIEVSVEVKDNTGAPVEDISVYLRLPSGRSTLLRRLSAGVYVAENSLRWDEPVGAGRVLIEGEKVVGNVTMLAVGEASIEINPARLHLSLLSPGPRVEVGETVEIKVKAIYPDGELAEGIVVTVTTPAGKSLTLVPKGSGIYSTAYVVTSDDVGSWNLNISANDIYGNSGIETSPVEVAPPGLGRVFATYWWAFLAIFAAAGVTSAYLTRRALLVQRLKKVRKEIRGIPQLKKETMIKYFKEGSIERDTYDELMDKHDTRLGELRKQEELLSAKVGKKIRVKKERVRKGRK